MVMQKGGKVVVISKEAIDKYKQLNRTQRLGDKVRELFYEWLDSQEITFPDRAQNRGE